jgi:peptide/nickel transport system substrate-binding protein
MRLVLTGACLAGFSLAATASDQPRSGGRLRLALRADPGSLDCHSAGASTQAFALLPAYSTLLKFDVSHYPSIVGDIARSWDISSDATAYTFHLYEDVKFHDGSPLTADDVKATYERLKSPPQGVTSARKGLFAGITSIEAPDKKTVVFKLAAANPAMLDAFAHPFNCIYSAAQLKADPTSPSRKVMGSGPFKLASYVPGAKLLYEKFPDYFKKPLPYLDGLELDILSNAAVVPAIISGQVDADLFGFSEPLRKQISDARGDSIRFDTVDTNTMSFVAFNPAREAFKDERVRRALNLAIDRRAGERSLPKLIAVGSYWPIYKKDMAYRLGDEMVSQLPGYGSDMYAARREAIDLLQKAGASNLRFSLISPNTKDPYETLSVFLIDSWRSIGVTVEWRPAELASYLSAKGSGDYDAAIDWASPVGANPIEVLEKYAQPQIAALSSDGQILLNDYASLRSTSDPQKTKDIAARFQKRLLENSYVLPLYWASRTTAVPSDLRGWRPPPSFYLGTDLAQVWRAN